MDTDGHLSVSSVITDISGVTEFCDNLTKLSETANSLLDSIDKIILKRRLNWRKKIFCTKSEKNDRNEFPDNSNETTADSGMSSSDIDHEYLDKRQFPLVNAQDSNSHKVLKASVISNKQSHHAVLREDSINSYPTIEFMPHKLEDFKKSRSDGLFASGSMLVSLASRPEKAATEDPLKNFDKDVPSLNRKKSNYSESEVRCCSSTRSQSVGDASLKIMTHTSLKIPTDHICTCGGFCLQTKQSDNLGSNSKSSNRHGTKGHTKSSARKIRKKSADSFVCCDGGSSCSCASKRWKSSKNSDHFRTRSSSIKSSLSGNLTQSGHSERTTSMKDTLRSAITCACTTPSENLNSGCQKITRKSKNRSHSRRDSTLSTNSCPCGSSCSMYRKSYDSFIRSKSRSLTNLNPNRDRSTKRSSNRAPKQGRSRSSKTSTRSKSPCPCGQKCKNPKKTPTGERTNALSLGLKTKEVSTGTQSKIDSRSHGSSSLSKASCICGSACTQIDSESKTNMGLIRSESSKPNQKKNSRFSCKESRSEAIKLFKSSLRQGKTNIGSVSSIDELYGSPKSSKESSKQSFRSPRRTARDRSESSQSRVTTLSSICSCNWAKDPLKNDSERSSNSSKQRNEHSPKFSWQSLDNSRRKFSKERSSGSELSKRRHRRSHSSCGESRDETFKPSGRSLPQRRNKSRSASLSRSCSFNSSTNLSKSHRRSRSSGSHQSYNCGSSCDQTETTKASKRSLSPGISVSKSSKQFSEHSLRHYSPDPKEKRKKSKHDNKHFLRSSSSPKDFKLRKSSHSSNSCSCDDDEFWYKKSSSDNLNNHSRNSRSRSTKQISKNPLITGSSCGGSRQQTGLRSERSLLRSQSKSSSIIGRSKTCGSSSDFPSKSFPRRLSKSRSSSKFCTCGSISSKDMSVSTRVSSAGSGKPYQCFRKKEKDEYSVRSSKSMISSCYKKTCRYLKENDRTTAKTGHTSSTSCSVCRCLWTKESLSYSRESLPKSQKKGAKRKKTETTKLREINSVATESVRASRSIKMKMQQKSSSTSTRANTDVLKGRSRKDGFSLRSKERGTACSSRSKSITLGMCSSFPRDAAGCSISICPSIDLSESDVLNNLSTGCSSSAEAGSASTKMVSNKLFIYPDDETGTAKLPESQSCTGCHETLIQLSPISHTPNSARKKRASSFAASQTFPSYTTLVAAMPKVSRLNATRTTLVSHTSNISSKQLTSSSSSNLSTQMSYGLEKVNLSAKDAVLPVAKRLVDQSDTMARRESMTSRAHTLQKFKITASSSNLEISSQGKTDQKHGPTESSTCSHYIPSIKQMESSKSSSTACSISTPALMLNHTSDMLRSTRCRAKEDKDANGCSCCRCSKKRTNPDPKPDQDDAGKSNDGIDRKGDVTHEPANLGVAKLEHSEIRSDSYISISPRRSPFGKRLFSNEKTGATNQKIKMEAPICSLNSFVIIDPDLPASGITRNNDVENSPAEKGEEKQRQPHSSSRSKTILSGSSTASCEVSSLTENRKLSKFTMLNELSKALHQPPSARSVFLSASSVCGTTNKASQESFSIADRKSSPSNFSCTSDRQNAARKLDDRKSIKDSRRQMQSSSSDCGKESKIRLSSHSIISEDRKTLDLACSKSAQTTVGHYRNEVSSAKSTSEFSSQKAFSEKSVHLLDKKSPQLYYNKICRCGKPIPSSHKTIEASECDASTSSQFTIDKYQKEEILSKPRNPSEKSLTIVGVKSSDQSRQTSSHIFCESTVVNSSIVSGETSIIVSTKKSSSHKKICKCPGGKCKWWKPRNKESLLDESDTVAESYPTAMTANQSSSEHVSECLSGSCKPKPKYERKSSGRVPDLRSNIGSAKPSSDGRKVCKCRSNNCRLKPKSEELPAITDFWKTNDTVCEESPPSPVGKYTVQKSITNSQQNESGTISEDHSTIESVSQSSRDKQIKQKAVPPTTDSLLSTCTTTTDSTVQKSIPISENSATTSKKAAHHENCRCPKCNNLLRCNYRRTVQRQDMANALSLQPTKISNTLSDDGSKRTQYNSEASLSLSTCSKTDYDCSNGSSHWSLYPLTSEKSGDENLPREMSFATVGEIVYMLQRLSNRIAKNLALERKLSELCGTKATLKTSNNDFKRPEEVSYVTRSRTSLRIDHESNPVLKSKFFDNAEVYGCPSCSEDTSEEKSQGQNTKKKTCKCKIRKKHSDRRHDSQSSLDCAKKPKKKPARARRPAKRPSKDGENKSDEETDSGASNTRVAHTYENSNNREPCSCRACADAGPSKHCRKQAKAGNCKNKSSFASCFSNSAKEKPERMADEIKSRRAASSKKSTTQRERGETCPCSDRCEKKAKGHAIKTASIPHIIDILQQPRIPLPVQQVKDHRKPTKSIIIGESKPAISCVCDNPYNSSRPPKVGHVKTKPFNLSTVFQRPRVVSSSPSDSFESQDSEPIEVKQAKQPLLVPVTLPLNIDDSPYQETCICDTRCESQKLPQLSQVGTKPVDVSTLFQRLRIPQQTNNSMNSESESIKPERKSQPKPKDPKPSSVKTKPTSMAEMLQKPRVTGYGSMESILKSTEIKSKPNKLKPKSVSVSTTERLPQPNETCVCDTVCEAPKSLKRSPVRTKPVAISEFLQKPRIPQLTDYDSFENEEPIEIKLKLTQLKPKPISIPEAVQTPREICICDSPCKDPNSPKPIPVQTKPISFTEIFQKPRVAPQADNECVEIKPSKLNTRIPVIVPSSERALPSEETCICDFPDKEPKRSKRANVKTKPKYLAEIFKKPRIPQTDYESVGSDSEPVEIKSVPSQLKPKQPVIVPNSEAAQLSKETCICDQPCNDPKTAKSVRVKTKPISPAEIFKKPRIPQTDYDSLESDSELLEIKPVPVIVPSSEGTLPSKETCNRDSPCKKPKRSKPVRVKTKPTSLTKIFKKPRIPQTDYESLESDRKPIEIKPLPSKLKPRLSFIVPSSEVAPSSEETCICGSLSNELKPSEPARVKNKPMSLAEIFKKPKTPQTDYESLESDSEPIEIKLKKSGKLFPNPVLTPKSKANCICEACDTEKPLKPSSVKTKPVDMSKIFQRPRIPPTTDYESLDSESSHLEESAAKQTSELRPADKRFDAVATSEETCICDSREIACPKSNRVTTKSMNISKILQRPRVAQPTLTDYAKLTAKPIQVKPKKSKEQAGERPSVTTANDDSYLHQCTCSVCEDRSKCKTGPQNCEPQELTPVLSKPFNFSKVFQQPRIPQPTLTDYAVKTIEQIEVKVNTPNVKSYKQIANTGERPPVTTEVEDHVPHCTCTICEDRSKCTTNLEDCNSPKATSTQTKPLNISSIFQHPRVAIPTLSDYSYQTANPIDVKGSTPKAKLSRPAKIISQGESAPPCSCKICENKSRCKPGSEDSKPAKPMPVLAKPFNLSNMFQRPGIAHPIPTDYSQSASEPASKKDSTPNVKPYKEIEDVFEKPSATTAEEHDIPHCTCKVCKDQLKCTTRPQDCETIKHAAVLTKPHNTSRMFQHPRLPATTFSDYSQQTAIPIEVKSSTPKQPAQVMEKPLSSEDFFSQETEKLAVISERKSVPTCSCKICEYKSRCKHRSQNCKPQKATTKPFNIPDMFQQPRIANPILMNPQKSPEPIKELGSTPTMHPPNQITDVQERSPVAIAADDHIPYCTCTVCEDRSKCKTKPEDCNPPKPSVALTKPSNIANMFQHPRLAKSTLSDYSYQTAEPINVKSSPPEPTVHAASAKGESLLPCSCKICEDKSRCKHRPEEWKLEKPAPALTKPFNLSSVFQKPRLAQQTLTDYPQKTPEHVKETDSSPIVQDPKQIVNVVEGPPVITAKLQTTEDNISHCTCTICEDKFKCKTESHDRKPAKATPVLTKHFNFSNILQRPRIAQPTLTDYVQKSAEPVQSTESRPPKQIAHIEEKLLSTTTEGGQSIPPCSCTLCENKSRCKHRLHDCNPAKSEAVKVKPENVSSIFQRPRVAIPTLTDYAEQSSEPVESKGSFPLFHSELQTCTCEICHDKLRCQNRLRDCPSKKKTPCTSCLPRSSGGSQEGNSFVKTPRSMKTESNRILIQRTPLTQGTPAEDSGRNFQRPQIKPESSKPLKVAISTESVDVIPACNCSSCEDESRCQVKNQERNPTEVEHISFKPGNPANVLQRPRLAACTVSIREISESVEIKPKRTKPSRIFERPYPGQISEPVKTKVSRLEPRPSKESVPKHPHEQPIYSAECSCQICAEKSKCKNPHKCPESEEKNPRKPERVSMKPENISNMLKRPRVPMPIDVEIVARISEPAEIKPKPTQSKPAMAAQAQNSAGVSDSGTYPCDACEAKPKAKAVRTKPTSVLYMLQKPRLPEPTLTDNTELRTAPVEFKPSLTRVPSQEEPSRNSPEEPSRNSPEENAHCEECYCKICVDKSRCKSPHKCPESAREIPSKPKRVSVKPESISNMMQRPRVPMPIDVEIVARISEPVEIQPKPTQLKPVKPAQAQKSAGVSDHCENCPCDACEAKSKPEAVRTKPISVLNMLQKPRLPESTSTGNKVKTAPVEFKPSAIKIPAQKRSHSTSPIPSKLPIEAPQGDKCSCSACTDHPRKCKSENQISHSADTHAEETHGMIDPISIKPKEPKLKSTHTEQTIGILETVDIKPYEPQVKPEKSDGLKTSPMVKPTKPAHSPETTEHGESCPCDKCPSHSRRTHAEETLGMLDPISIKPKEPKLKSTHSEQTIGISETVDIKPYEPQVKPEKSEGLKTSPELKPTKPAYSSETTDHGESCSCDKCPPHSGRTHAEETLGMLDPISIKPKEPKMKSTHSEKTIGISETVDIKPCDPQVKPEKSDDLKTSPTVKPTKPARSSDITEHGESCFCDKCSSHSGRTHAEETLGMIEPIAIKSIKPKFEPPKPAEIDTTTVDEKPSIAKPIEIPSKEKEHPPLCECIKCEKESAVKPHIERIKLKPHQSILWQRPRVPNTAASSYFRGTTSIEVKPKSTKPIYTAKCDCNICKDRERCKTGHEDCDAEEKWSCTRCFSQSESTSSDDIVHINSTKISSVMEPRPKPDDVTPKPIKPSKVVPHANKIASTILQTEATEIKPKGAKSPSPLRDVSIPRIGQTFDIELKPPQELPKGKAVPTREESEVEKTPTISNPVKLIAKPSTNSLPTVQPELIDEHPDTCPCTLREEKLNQLQNKQNKKAPIQQKPFELSSLFQRPRVPEPTLTEYVERIINPVEVKPSTIELPKPVTHADECLCKICEDKLRCKTKSAECAPKKKSSWGSCYPRRRESTDISVKSSQPEHSEPSHVLQVPSREISSTQSMYSVLAFETPIPSLPSAPSTIRVASIPLKPASVISNNSLSVTTVAGGSSRSTTAISCYPSTQQVPSKPSTTTINSTDLRIPSCKCRVCTDIENCKIRRKQYASNTQSDRSISSRNSSNLPPCKCKETCKREAYKESSSTIVSKDSENLPQCKCKLCKDIEKCKLKRRKYTAKTKPQSSGTDILLDRNRSANTKRLSRSVLCKYKICSEIIRCKRCKSGKVESEFVERCSSTTSIDSYERSTIKQLKPSQISVKSELRDSQISFTTDSECLPSETSSNIVFSECWNPGDSASSEFKTPFHQSLTSSNEDSISPASQLTRSHSVTDISMCEVTEKSLETEAEAASKPYLMPSQGFLLPGSVNHIASKLILPSLKSSQSTFIKSTSYKSTSTCIPTDQSPENVSTIESLQITTSIVSESKKYVPWYAGHSNCPSTDDQHVYFTRTSKPTGAGPSKKPASIPVASLKAPPEGFKPKGIDSGEIGDFEKSKAPCNCPLCQAMDSELESISDSLTDSYSLPDNISRSVSREEHISPNCNCPDCVTPKKTGPSILASDKVEQPGQIRCTCFGPESQCRCFARCLCKNHPNVDRSNRKVLRMMMPNDCNSAAYGRESGHESFSAQNAFYSATKHLLESDAELHGINAAARTLFRFVFVELKHIKGMLHRGLNFDITEERNSTFDTFGPNLNCPCSNTKNAPLHDTCIFGGTNAPISALQTAFQSSILSRFAQPILPIGYNILSSKPAPPVQILSVKPVGNQSLMVTWMIVKCYNIGGYEIVVDGCLKFRTYSPKRNTAIVYGVDVNQKHQIRVIAVPEKNILSRNPQALKALYCLPSQYQRTWSHAYFYDPRNLSI